MDRHYAAVAPELVIGAPKGDAVEVEEGQRPRTHDAGLTRHKELTSGKVSSNDVATVLL